MSFPFQQNIAPAMSLGLFRFSFRVFPPVQAVEAGRSTVFGDFDLARAPQHVGYRPHLSTRRGKQALHQKRNREMPKYNQSRDDQEPAQHGTPETSVNGPIRGGRSDQQSGIRCP